MAQPKSNRSLPKGAERQERTPLPSGSTLGPLLATRHSHRGADSIGIPIVLFVVVVWAFLPSLRNGFVDYDDSLFVTENAQVQQGVSWQNVIWAFRNEVAANWHPLTTLSHMLDCQLYGPKPWGHHLTNVLLHAVNTVLLFLVFRRMTGAVWRCAALAALFALHPLRVESVTWVSERKDVLSTAFWMLTLWTYVRFVEMRREDSTRTKRFYWLTMLCFSLGLLSKSMVVTLPFALLLLDYWPLQRLWPTVSSPESPGLRKLLVEKLPLFGLAAIASALAFATQTGAKNITGGSVLPLAPRVENAVVSYGRYLGKMFWPVDLSPFYPYPPAGWGMATVALSGVAVLGVSVLVVLLRRQRRYLPTGWFWFVGTLIPVIGLVQIGRQSMGDHYTYIPSIGALVLLIWGVHDLTSRWRWQAVSLSAVTVAAAVACISLTREQIRHWKDDESLWRHAVAVTRNNDFAHYNLAFALASQEKFDEAIPQYEDAIRINPGQQMAHSGLAYALTRTHRRAEAMREYGEALRLKPSDAASQNSMGSLLAEQGRLEEALPYFREALRLRPNFLEAHYDLGLALRSLKRYGEAAAEFREVLGLDPNHPGAQEKLGEMLAAQERPEQATERYRQALRLNPRDARAHGGLGRVLLEAGNLDEAIQHCTEAARLDPKSAELQYHLGVALARRGETEKAAHQFELALEIEPKLAAAHYALGILYQHQRRMPEALKQWREAARLAPHWPDPLNSLAWVLATDAQPELRNGAEAVKLASQALELAGTNNVRILDTLAAAYAEAGRFAEASSTARQAAAAAAAQGQEELAGQVQQRLALYGANHPYREKPDAK